MSAADEALRERAWAVAAEVCDPEIPVLTIADLGILRSVEVKDGVVEVAITPTYSGCPAMDVIGLDLVTCPHCGSARTERISEFGSTACKALWRCGDCREPFDAFKCH